MVAGFFDEVFQSVDSRIFETFHSLQLHTPASICDGADLVHLVESGFFPMEVWKVSTPNIPAILLTRARIDVQTTVFLQGSPGLPEEIREREMMNSVEGGDEIQREIPEWQISALTVYGLEVLDISLPEIQAQLFQHFPVGVYAVKVEPGAHVLVKLQRISPRTASHIGGVYLGKWFEPLADQSYRARVGHPEVSVPGRYR